jgi:hypothetical protein
MASNSKDEQRLGNYRTRCIMREIGRLMCRRFGTWSFSHVFDLYSLLQSLDALGRTKGSEMMLDAAMSTNAG